MAAADCPACGKRGRRVKPTTLDALLHDGTEHRDAAWRFCATLGCEVAWFGEETGRRIPTSASRVRIFQKKTNPQGACCLGNVRAIGRLKPPSA